MKGESIMIYTSDIPPNPIGGGTCWGNYNYNQNVNYNNGYGNGYYNSGYYNQNNNGYVGYHNPYLEAEMRKRDEEESKRQVRQQQQIIRNITKSINPDMSDEELDRVSGMYDANQYEDFYGDTTEDVEVQLYLSNTNYLYNLNQQSQQIDYKANFEMNLARQLEEQRALGVPEDCSLFDYMNKYGNEITYNILQQEAKAEKMKQVNNLFDKGKFDQYLDQYCRQSFGYQNSFDNNSNNPMSSLAPIDSIDDLEFKVPDPREREDAERYARFQAKIRENAMRF